MVVNKSPTNKSWPAPVNHCDIPAKPATTTHPKKKKNKEEEKEEGGGGKNWKRPISSIQHA